MHSEWSLLFFTLLIQMSAGGLTFLITHNVLKGTQHDLPTIKRNFLVLFVIAFSGVILSFSHLGSPLHAYNALNNLGSSWISAETLTVSMLLLALFLLNLNFQNLLKFNSSIIKLLYAFGIISSIAVTFSMVKLYTAPTIMFWSKSLTWFEFINSTILLGGTIFLIGFPKQTITGIKTFILALMGIMIISDFFPILFEWVEFNSIYYPVLITMIIAFLLIGSSIVSLLKYGRTNSVVLNFLMVLIVIIEISGRYFFYSSFQSVGI